MTTESFFKVAPNCDYTVIFLTQQTTSISHFDGVVIRFAASCEKVGGDVKCFVEAGDSLGYPSGTLPVKRTYDTILRVTRHVIATGLL